MAYATDYAAPKVLGTFTRLSAKLADLIDLIALSRSRARLFEELNNLSDAELAAKGLRRDTIVNHVISNRFHV